MNTLSTNIKKCRIQKGFTQQQLADVIGVSSQAVSKWEKGSMPDASILPNIADALDVSIDYLYGRKSFQQSDIYEHISQSIEQQDDKIAFSYNLAWVSAVEGLCGKKLFGIIGKDTPVIGKVDGGNQIAQIFTNNSFLIGDFTSEDSFMLFSKKVKKTYDELFMSVHDSSKLFSLLADEKTIEILLCLAHLKPEVLILSDSISKQVSLSASDTEKRLEKLFACRIVKRQIVMQDNEEKKAYKIWKVYYIYALLLIAKSIYESQSIAINADDYLNE